MTAGEIAGLIAAAALLILVGLLAIPILKLGKLFDKASETVEGVSDRSMPLLDEVTTTVTTTNAQLERVDAITSNTQTVTNNAAALSSVFAATVGGPLVKIAAFSYGVRRVLTNRSRRDIERQVKAEMKAGRRRKGRTT